MFWGIESSPAQPQPSPSPAQAQQAQPASTQQNIEFIGFLGKYKRFLGCFIYIYIYILFFLVFLVF